jgi:Domain of unknown function (DUF4166)
MPPSPFEQLLGPDFAVLPEPVRRFHSLRADATSTGRADITSPRGVLPWLICKVSGLPAPGKDVPVSVAFEIDGRGGEFWRRSFAGRRYQSGFSAGSGRYAGLLCERFFPYVFFHRLTPSAEGLRWDLIGWKLLFLPLPRWLMPLAVCFESGDGDRFVFDIDAAFRIVGPVVHYRGWLAQD